MFDLNSHRTRVEVDSSSGHPPTKGQRDEVTTSGTSSSAVDHRIHVLHILTRLDRGGSAENTLITVSGLDKTRYRVTLVSGASQESKMTAAEIRRLTARLQTVRESGVEIVTLRSLVRRISPWHDLLALLAMVRLIRRLRPTVIHTHTSKAGVLGRLAARLCGTRVLVHTPHGHLFYGYYSSAVSALIVVIERWLGGMTDCLIALTNIGKMEYLDRKIVTAERVMAVYSGVESDTGAVGRPVRTPRHAQERELPGIAAVHVAHPNLDSAGPAGRKQNP